MPHSDDLYHRPVPDVPKLPRERAAYIIDNNIVTDEYWWMEQYKRCLFGYDVPNAINKGGDAFVDGVDCYWSGNDCYIPQYDWTFKDRMVHISGRHYFYLNFWPIYGLDEALGYKTVIVPRFLDMDFFFYRRIEMMREQAKDSQDLKGRQLGFSEKGAGGVLGWNYTFVPASVNLIIGGQETDAEHTMENCERGLSDLVNTQFYLDRAKGGDSSSLLKSKETKSEIRVLTARDNHQTASRYTPYFVWYEEIGKGKELWSVKTAKFVEPSLKQGVQKTGYQIFIGTGGDMLAGAIDLEKRHFNPDRYNILSFNNIFERPDDSSLISERTGHFTAKWMFKVIDKDGNSLKKESFKALDEEEKNLDPTDRYIHMTQNARYASDAFLISGGGYFGEHIVQLMNSRKAYINTHPGSVRHIACDLFWKDPKNPFKGVDWKANDEGFCHIFEIPSTNQDGLVYGNLYKAATDSYDQDEALSSPSKGSIVVKKLFLDVNETSNKYVARITERPETAKGGSELFYEHTAMVCVMYNAINLIEYSKIRIFDWYIKNGFESLLKERPEFIMAAMIQKTVTINRYGIDPASKPHWLAYLKDDLTADAIEKIDDVDLLSFLIKFKYDPSGKRYNCDVTICVALLSVLGRDDEHLLIDRGEEEVRERPRSFVTKNGVLIAQN